MWASKVAHSAEKIHNLAAYHYGSLNAETSMILSKMQNN